MNRKIHLALSLYLPVFLFSFVRGLILPVIPLFAGSLGAALGTVGIIAAAYGFGALVMDLPSGFIVSRLGPAASMTVGFCGMGMSALGMALAPGPLSLGLFHFGSGAFLALWNVSRMSYMKSVLPVEQRGRALSLMGGVLRIGTFVGPIAGGFTAELAGYPSVFLLQTFLLLTAAGITVIMLPRRTRTASAEANAALKKAAGGVFLKQLLSSRKVLLTAGGAMIALQFLRAARQLIYPLWGEYIGITVGETGLIMGISSGIELALFIPVGFIMDRKGRKWTAVPCILVLAFSFLLLPLAGGFWTMLMVGLTAGLGNGLGAGINMTFGSDLSPRKNPEQFLSLWHFLSDGGRTLAPVVAGSLAAVIGLVSASFVVAVVGGIGAGVMAFLVAEPLKNHSR
ncbi:MAG: MFS transporter [Spirochaetia bacterium]